MAVSFSAAADRRAEGSSEVLAAGFAAAGAAETFPDGEAAGPLADRLASPLPPAERRVGGEALAPVAARVGLGTALPAAFVPVTDTAGAACAPVAASDAFVLLVVTAVILAL